jgi:hypothetical protein
MDRPPDITRPQALYLPFHACPCKQAGSRHRAWGSLQGRSVQPGVGLNVSTDLLCCCSRHGMVVSTWFFMVAVIMVAVNIWFIMLLFQAW